MNELWFLLALGLAGMLLFGFWRSGRFSAEHMSKASSTMAVLAIILMGFVSLLVLFLRGDF